MKNSACINKEIEAGEQLHNELSKHTSLIQKKYLAVMKDAQEILSGSVPHGYELYDSLNCGKMSKLIRYIKSSSACFMLSDCYGENLANKV